MSVCPWCKATAPHASDLCPACGRNPAEHPSIASAGYASFGGFDDIEEAPSPVLDDLNRAIPGVAAQNLSGGSFDDRDFDDDLEGNQPLSLDPAHLPTRAGAAPVHITKPSAASAALIGGFVEDGAIPTPTPPPPLPALDPVEVAVTADFGRQPDNLWLCPAYALRVFKRRRELAAQLRQAQSIVADAERSRDDRLVQIAENARPTIEDDRELAGYLRPLIAAEQMGTEREKALALRSADYSAAVAGIDKQIAQEQATLDEIQSKMALAKKDHDEKAQLLARGQALLKRAEIELRNAQDVARAAAGPEAKSAPPEHAASILQAQQVVEQRRTELVAPKQVADAASTIVNEWERKAKEVNRRLGALRDERKKHEQAFSREAGLRAEGVSQAQTQRRAALIALGARLVDTGSPAIATADIDAFGDIRGRVLTLRLDVERLLRAIDSADSLAVRKGWALIAGAVSLTVLLLVLLIVTFGRTL